MPVRMPHLRQCTLALQVHERTRKQRNFSRTRPPARWRTASRTASLPSRNRHRHAREAAGAGRIATENPPSPSLSECTNFFHSLSLSKPRKYHGCGNGIGECNTWPKTGNLTLSTQGSSLPRRCPSLYLHLKTRNPANKKQDEYSSLLIHSRRSAPRSPLRFQPSQTLSRASSFRSILLAQMGYFAYNMFVVRTLLVL